MRRACQPHRPAVRLGDALLPLMVMDYIGAMNTYLALPFFALFGVNVVAMFSAGCANAIPNPTSPVLR